MKKRWKEKEWKGKFMVAVCVITVIVTALLFLLVVLNEEKKSEKRWNNGICSECNIGHYEFIQAVGHLTETTYIYECDNCGHKNGNRLCP